MGESEIECRILVAVFLYLLFILRNDFLTSNFSGEPSKLDTVSGITTEDLEAELEMDLDNLKLDDIDTTDVNLDDEELLED